MALCLFMFRLGGLVTLVAEPCSAILVPPEFIIAPDKFEWVSSFIAAVKCMYGITIVPVEHSLREVFGNFNDPRMFSTMAF